VHLDEPFYWYSDPDILMRDLSDVCGNFGASDPDVTLINTAEKHPMRTTDISKAKFFLITIPTVSLWFCSKDRATERMKRALRKLVASESWQETGGRRHVWSLFDWRIMRWADETFKRIPDDSARGKWADHQVLMKHVTVLTYENWQGHPHTCKVYSKKFDDYCHPADYNWMPFEYWGCTVVVPYLAGEGALASDVQKHYPTESFEKWSGRKHVLFYRNDMKREYFWNATPVRRKPIELENMTETEIGDVHGKMEHLRGLRNSRFCIVTRGDTPSSHKMYDAIRELCVPVIISDLFFTVAKPFPTILAWDTFTVSIPEAHFMKNPKHAVAHLWTLAPGELRRLHGALVEARRVLDWRAPDSLTTEAALASTVDVCMPGPVDDV